MNEPAAGRVSADRQQVMTFATHEFIRRFLLHVLPCGFHRILHYGLLCGIEPQELHRARPQAAEGRVTARRRGGQGTAGYTGTMPILRRKDGRDRVLRPLETAPCAAIWHMVHPGNR